MRRTGAIALSVALLVGLTGVLGAQDDGNVSAEDGNTTVEIDGKVKTKLFRRDSNINTILNGGTSSEDQSSMLYRYQLGVTADVGDRVTGRLEVENPLLDSTATSGAAANDTALIGEDTEGDNVQISEAYVEADRFLAEPLSLTVGIQGYETDLRGNGNPFFLDLQGSEGISDSRASVLEGAAAAGRNLNNDAGGVKLTTDVSPDADLDLFWFTVREDTTAASRGDDENILGGVFKGNLQDIGSYQLVGTVFQDVTPDSTTDRIWTVGGGVEYDVASALNAYGEGYFQGGSRDATSDQDTSFAANLGLDGEANLFHYGVSGTYVTGDDGSDVGSGDDNEDFVSYEDNDATMILEDNVLGLDVDSNYWKAQVKGGVTGSVVRQDDLTLELLAAWAETEEDVAAPAAGTIDNNLGLETDLTLTWTHSESLDFQIGVARLWGADFFTDSGGFYGTTSDDLDLYTFTSSLHF